MIRIVKMTFELEAIPTFLETFEHYKDKIRNQPGCQYLELIQGIDSPHIIMTYSHWNTPEDLENYRQSDLFKEVWKLTKMHFSDRPEAWSLDSKYSIK